MGFRASWLAVKDGNLERTLRTLGLRRVSDSHEPIWGPGHFAMTMPSGWLVVIGDGTDEMEAVLPEHARTLSRGTETLYFRTNGTTMCASIAAYRDGGEVWGLIHDRSREGDIPSLTGTPVETVERVVSRLRNEEAEAQEPASDYCDFLYDAAPAIGKELTGFRHDEYGDNGEVLSFNVLEPVE